MSHIFQRAFWISLAGACAIAIVAVVPVLMSGVMDRGFEIAKQSVAEPLAALALGAILLAGGINWLREAGAATRIAAGSLIMFLLLAVVSSLLSENPAVAIFGGYYRREGLLAWGIYGAYFFAVLGWARRRDRLEALFDVLLLASVIPAAYALQQRLDLDFYPLGMREFARPGGTLGSPLFLAAYLGLLLPITISRCWRARGAWPDLMLWLTVATIQACGLLITQTRGPLLAALTGMLMLACFAAGYARARRVFAGAIAAFSLVVAALVAFNTVPPVRLWAQDVPVISRLVFSLDREAGAATRRASNSAATRLAIWGTGVETFAAASLETKLLGYGPESAYMHYFRYLPPSVMRMAGYGAYRTYDRMHADALDIGLNFGFLAYLVYSVFWGAVMFAAIRVLFGLSGRPPAWIFIAFSVSFGGLSSIAAVLAGLAAAAVPAFGIGAGAGCLLFVAVCAWRALKRGVPRVPAGVAGRWSLLAALASALLVFWIDAQVNIPVLTTRLISFAIAACILIMADGFSREAVDNADTAAAPENRLRIWGVAFSLVAGCAICLPVILSGAGPGAQELHALRRALPILTFLPIAAWAVWVLARRSGNSTNSAVCAALGVALGMPLIFAVAHFALIVKPDATMTLDVARSISIASFAVPVFMLIACIAYALLTDRAAAPVDGRKFVSRTARWSVMVVAALTSMIAVLDWRAVQADVASWLAPHAVAKQAQSGEQLIEEAVRIQPYERYYRRQLVFELLGKAVAEIPGLAEFPDRTPEVMRNLAGAETAARTAALLFPRDPWVIGALANVLQVKALQSLRPFDPAGGQRAANEAYELFAHAHRMFPSEPLLLRNWAQLMFDQGNLSDAYRLLDLMEKLIPAEPESYAERIAMAGMARDRATISATLSRARDGGCTGLPAAVDCCKRATKLVLFSGAWICLGASA